MYENQNKVSKKADNVSNNVNEKIEAILEGDTLDKYQDVLKFMFQQFVASDFFTDFSQRDKEEMTQKFYDIQDLIGSLKGKTA